MAPCPTPASSAGAVARFWWRATWIFRCSDDGQARGGRLDPILDPRSEIRAPLQIHKKSVCSPEKASSALIFQRLKNMGKHRAAGDSTTILNSDNRTRIRT